jgi:hypothetical protein
LGFYLRKSVRVGPFRFHLSTPGVGLSAGVRGLRIGSGPRGNYVHMGRHGLYYRATLPGSPATPPPRMSATVAPPTTPMSDAPTEIHTESVAALQDSSAASLLEEIEQKRRIRRLAPIVGLLGAVATFSMVTSGVPWAVLLVGAATTGLFVLARRRDLLAETVVVLYQLDPDEEHRYQSLHDAFQTVLGSAAAWHVDTTARTADAKRHAGVSTLLGRSALPRKSVLPANVATNIDVPVVPAGSRRLCFFPDRLLVFDSSTVGSVPYEKLKIERAQVRFVESGPAPGDAQTVGETWQYVNKTGGPDQRFKNNRHFPIVLYEAIQLTSATGLNELVEVSKLDAGRSLEEALTQLAAASHAAAAGSGPAKSPETLA